MVEAKTHCYGRRQTRQDNRKQQKNSVEIEAYLNPEGFSQNQTMGSWLPVLDMVSYEVSFGIFQIFETHV